MFKIFKPYMLLLLILLASSSIAMAQDCDDDSSCRIGYICEYGDCVPNVNLDRDRDGVPDAVDNCPDVANADQNDRDGDGIGFTCDDDVQAGAYINGYVKHWPEPTREISPFAFAGVKILELEIQTIADEYGQYALRNVPEGDWTIEVYPPQGEYYEPTFTREPVHAFNYEVTRQYAFDILLVDISVNPPGTIAGRVLLEDEEILSPNHGEIRVTFFTEDESYEVFTRGSGAFLSPYLYGGEYSVTFSKEGYIPIRLEEVNVVGLTRQNIERYELEKIGCVDIKCFTDELLAYFGIGDYDNALFTAIESVEFADNNFKGLDAQMALTYNNLGFVHFTLGNHEEAEVAYIQALQIWEETLDPDHPNVGASLNNLATLYEKVGEYKQAEKYNKRSKEIWQKAQEDASSKLADICDSMTEILFVCPTDNKK